ncbi:sensor histidine kinase [Streptomyces spirodelae]|uniref:histidine kinase n=1 Tax=Streptomyces spirodelae TaxID=2812904 RepID=A0ABS3WWY1_9ACTN|nr:sensor histidine kinase [Streptomyces spirodelae]MBO8187356.1 sensor histidine kinase [Streptomyces spirodelae]
MRVGKPRRVSSHVLAAQLALVVGVTALVSGLFLAPLSDQLDRQAMRRALAIAQTTAARPGLAAELTSAAHRAQQPTARGPLQREAERIRHATGAEYVVIMDERGIRWAHPSPSALGHHVSTDPGQVLAGHDVTKIDVGTLGRTARGKAPLRDSGGRIIGAVSVGIDYANVREGLLALVPRLLTYAGGALAVGALAAYLLARRLRRRTHALAFSDISALLAEREAMLHGLAEGVVALDADGRVRLVNDEAQRLLGLGPEALGRPVTEALGPGRTADVLAGRVTGRDLVTVRGARVLVANRMPTADGGAVATLRDRTELERLGRELEGTRGLLDALRAQDHEHANRLHTLLGLLELGLYEEAAQFVTGALGVRRATAEEVTERVHDPLVSALLVGKAVVAAERGVALRLAPDSFLPDRLVDPSGLVTVVGNLVDNALDAAAGSAGAAVEVDLRGEDGRSVVLTVRDTGPGVPPEHRALVFEEGWSTKAVPIAFGEGTGEGDRESGEGGGAHRGLGLALVRRFAERAGGEARIGESAQGGAEFRVVLPEALEALEPLQSLELDATGVSEAEGTRVSEVRGG